MEQDKQEFLPNPKETANPLSALTFFWTIPIFKMGYSKPIELKDLYETLKQDKSNTIGDTLERHYMKYVNKCNARRKELGITDPTVGPQPSLGKALAKTFWVEILYLGLIVVFNEIFVKLLSPVLLGKLLTYFSPESTMAREEAIYCAGGIVALSGASALAMNHYMLGAFHMGMRARVAVCSLIYRKSLRLSRTALGDSAPGKVVNLLSNDVNRFDIVSIFLHYIWVAPLVSVIVLYFLWSEVGPSGILGMVVVFTVMPIQAYTGKLSAKFRLQTALKTDERVRFMGEIISGVQVIKMYAWEKPFQALITLARRLEIKVIRKNSYVRAVFMTFLLTTTRIALFFVLFSMVMMGSKITSAKVFVISSYFSLLAATISSMFVRAIAEVAEAYVALKRLQKYLSHEEFETKSLVKYTNGISDHSHGDKNSNVKDGCLDLSSSLNSYGSMEQHSKVDFAVKMVKAEAKWASDKPEMTLDINHLQVKKGKLIGIIGPVGAGKSSLLQALLHELPLSKGSVEVNGNVSYACQEPWVFGGSVRQNIIFGMPFEKTKYKEVIRVCSLQKDLEQFPFGDKTLVGERGTSLSGGQKARINLARAVYRRADVYLLDDPLSAVDAHVGRQLFDQCIRSFLRHRTTLLVTHQLHYLKDADHIILLKDGKIEIQGTYQELSNSSGQFAQLLVPTHTSSEEEQPAGDVGEDGRKERRDSYARQRRRSRITPSRKRSESISSSLMDLNDLSLSRGDSEEDNPEDEDGASEEIADQHAVAEASSRHTVPGNIGYQYLKAGTNWPLMILVLAAFVISQVSVSAADYWMSFWASQEELRDYYKGQQNASTEENYETTLLPDTTTELFQGLFASNFSSPMKMEDTDLPEPDTLWDTYTCMWVHGTIVALALAFTLFRSFTFYDVAMRASQKLHDLMFRGVVRSPMMFFNLNPSGRIMNRFAKDMGAIDELLPKAILDASQVLLQMVGSIVLACYINPYFLVPIAILGSLFMIIRKIYLKTSKNIKRMEGVARSPVFTHLNATLQGLTTIRAYGAQDILKAEFDHYQDVHTAAWYMFITTSSAFGLVLDVLCLILIGLVTFSFLVISSNILGDKVGLAITQCMSLTFMVQWGIRQSAEVANQLMAVERVMEYTLMTPENGIEPDDIDKACKTPQARKVMALKLKKPSKVWPEDGRITFKNLSLKYTNIAEDACVLIKLNCEIKPQEKIGIVGRTGAGKSSLISALFRLAFNEGSIIIDGIDTKDISVTDLRKKISIIPQDPVLFSGTLRRNLDPFEEFSDAALWQALDEVELKDAITGPAGLESKVMDGGSNYSVGQRQLVCLARAILRNNKILMLDEATANVDPHTDSLIQKTIREKFAQCTVLTVAHRLNTIMDSDRVLVMDHGRIVEFDHPHVLLKNSEGFLSKMAAETGKHNCEQLCKVARENYNLKHSPLDDIKMIDE